MGSDSSSDIVLGYLNLLRRSSVPPKIAASFLSASLPAYDPSRRCALILSPHPDDECLTGALALRLMQEQGWRIINIAITLGSNSDRRLARKTELANACGILGFEGILSDEDGFCHVTHATRQENAPLWQKMVARVASIITHYKPGAIFMPHAQDAHPTHIGTHLLSMDALAKQSGGFSCSVIQTEYWHPMTDANVMIGINESDASKLLSALSCHVGENARNPFDTRFPAYLIDNVRRGSERVGGKGAVAAKMDFAMLYKLGIWRSGKFIPSALRRIFGTEEGGGDGGLRSLFDN